MSAEKGQMKRQSPSRRKPPDGLEIALDKAAYLPGETAKLKITPRFAGEALITGAPEGRVADAIFEGLALRDPRTLRPVPGVARGWEATEDGLVWTFHLRPEARS